MQEITLSNGKVWKFKDDVTIGEIDSLGDEPNATDSKKVLMMYNRKKMCLFSVEPKLTEKDIAELTERDFMLVFKRVILDYNQTMKDFLYPPKPK